MLHRQIDCSTKFAKNFVLAFTRLHLTFVIGESELNLMEYVTPHLKNNFNLNEIPHR